MAIRTVSARRRQRSVRVTVSVSLLVLATVLVAVALPTQSPLLLSLAAVGAIVLSWAALRIMYTEVIQTRRQHARDRAVQASTYQELFAERAVEHARFTTAMTDNLAAARLQVEDLTVELARVQADRARSEATLADTEARLVEAHQRVTDLETRVVSLQAEVEAAADEALASWEATRIEESALTHSVFTRSHTA